MLSAIVTILSWLHTSKREGSARYAVFSFISVPVPEEHPDVSQGVPRQVRSEEQRALRPLRPV